MLFAPRQKPNIPNTLCYNALEEQMIYRLRLKTEDTCWITFPLSIFHVVFCQDGIILKKPCKYFDFVWYPFLQYMLEVVAKVTSSQLIIY
jgi:hypothetical protein